MTEILAHFGKIKNFTPPKYIGILFEVVPWWHEASQVWLLRFWIFIQSIIIIDPFAFLIILLVFLADHDAELRNSGSSPSLACAAKESKSKDDVKKEGFDDVYGDVVLLIYGDVIVEDAYTGDEGCHKNRGATTQKPTATIAKPVSTNNPSFISNIMELAINYLAFNFFLSAPKENAWQPSSPVYSMPSSLSVVSPS